MCISEAKRPDDYHKQSWWEVMLALHCVLWVYSVGTLPSVHTTDQIRQPKLYQDLAIIIGMLSKEQVVDSVMNTETSFQNTVKQKRVFIIDVNTGFSVHNFKMLQNEYNHSNWCLQYSFTLHSLLSLGHKKRLCIPACKTNSQQNISKQSTKHSL